MPAGSIRTPNDARTIEAGMLLIGAGALLLLLSLFLEWYEPGIDAWEIFEVWDLVLAVLAIVALVAVASRMGVGPPRPPSWLLGPTVAALVIVLYLLVNPPPLTPDVDGDPSTGLWLALACTLLMLAGAVLSVARISVAISPADPPGAGHVVPPDHAAPTTRSAGGRVDPPAESAPGPGPGRPGETPPTEPTRRV